MTFHQLTRPFPWVLYSKKLQEKIAHPVAIGLITEEEAKARDLRLCEAKVGDPKLGNAFSLYLLVDKEDGIIVDAKYQAFCQSALLGALESACHLLIGKNYDQAKRISEELLDKNLRDKGEKKAFPNETQSFLYLVLEGIQKGAEQCTDLPLSTSYIAPLAAPEIGEVIEGGIEGFKDFSKEQKISLIEEVLDRDVRPFIAMDEGGITLLDLKDWEILIAYQGSCTSCYSSVGSTLTFIQQVVRAKVHPDLFVTPQI